MWSRPRHRWLTALLLGGLVTVGCASEGSDVATPTTTVPATTTTEATTTSTSATATTSTPTTAPDQPPFHDDGPSGSGCTPGPGDLPDGWWYGLLKGTSNGAVSFDLACYYTGAAAVAEATSRGDEVNNDYYVVNDNPQVRSVPLAADVMASCVQLDATLQMVDCGVGDIAGDFAVWLRVVDGVADRVVEQYAP